MAITYFGSASTPADNGTSTGTPIAVTPPGSMLAGDLVVIYGYYRGTSTIAVSQAGGQTWTTLAASSTASGPVLSTFATWCTFNGTWGANPSLSFSTSSTNTNVVMHVFRPTSTSSTWGVEVAGFKSGAAAPGSPFTCTCFIGIGEIGSGPLAADANLLGYWKLENTSATTGGFTLTNSGSVTFAAGKFNNGAEMGTGGTTNYLQVGSGLGLNLRTSAATISAWVKFSSIPSGVNVYRRIIDWRSTTGTASYIILDYATQGAAIPGFLYDVAGTVTHHAVTLTTGTWYHVCLTQPSGTGGTTRLYLDGTQISTASKGSSGSTDVFVIGNTPSGSPAYSFPGIIDDVAVFSRELSAAEVLSIATGGGGVTIRPSTVTVGGIITDDDNTWGTLSGSGYASTGTAQYRNTSGSDSSSTYAHRILASAGQSIIPFTKNQATNGGDPYVSISGVFYEIPDPAPPSTTLKDMIGMGIIPYLR